ncbi:Uncharacterised protein [Vibrio cholerae]|nr:Uncharacterised protein [Vibrio cholerae]CSB94004.1 Uncharacterised protein [Vibrio cholerae]CSC05319.1 Uncharacterised protein [Vibrio cholerae]CSC11168.1 Uncharacterised protein [Vibrio cholerae]CSC61641.1 Uncharacterised protein [Vibrio cholerae]
MNLDTLYDSVERINHAKKKALCCMHQVWSQIHQFIDNFFGLL